MPLPTSAGRSACLRRVPFPGARSESGSHAWPSRALQARTRAYTGRAHVVFRFEEAPEGGMWPVGGATTAWPGRRARRENSPPATGAMPSRHQKAQIESEMPVLVRGRGSRLSRSSPREVVEAGRGAEANAELRAILGLRDASRLDIIVGGDSRFGCGRPGFGVAAGGVSHAARLSAVLRPDPDPSPSPISRCSGGSGTKTRTIGERSARAHLRRSIQTSTCPGASRSRSDRCLEKWSRVATADGKPPESSNGAVVVLPAASMVPVPLRAGRGRRRCPT